MPQVFSLQERLDCGNLSIGEVCELKRCSVRSFYRDVRSGLVALKKHGRKSVVPGPIAKRYIAGEPM